MNSARHPASPPRGNGDGGKQKAALARLHSARSLNRSQGFTAGCRGSFAALTGRALSGERLLVSSARPAPFSATPDGVTHSAIRRVLSVRQLRQIPLPV